MTSGGWAQCAMLKESYVLLEGDCLRILRDVPDHTVDLVLADPPYGTTGYAWDAVINVEGMWRELKRVLKPTGVIVLWGKQPFSSVLVNSNLKMFQLPLVWNKNAPSNHMQARRRPLQIHEDILVFYNTVNPTYNPQMTEGHPPYVPRRKRANSSYHWKNSKPYKPMNVGVAVTTRYPTSVIEFPRVSAKGRLHKTQKPVELAEWLIKTWSNEGDIVLDFCMGSGTTGVAAMNTKRVFFGCELDPVHFSNAEARVSAAWRASCTQ